MVSPCPAGAGGARRQLGNAGNRPVKRPRNGRANRAASSASRNRSKGQQPGQRFAQFAIEPGPLIGRLDMGPGMVDQML